MLEVKDTQKPRESKGEKNMESGYTPPIIIWHFWSRSFYLDFISLIIGSKIQRTTLRLSGFMTLFFWNKAQFHRISFINILHSSGEGLIFHLQMSSLSLPSPKESRGQKQFFLYVYSWFPLPPSTPCINSNFKGNQETT